MKKLPTKNTLLFISGAFGLVALGFILGHITAPDFRVGASSQATSEENRLQAGPGNESASVSILSQDAAASLRAFQHQPATPAGEQSLCTQLQQLAIKEPLRALELAASAPTPRQRELFRNAALQGWATRDPHAAGVWTLSNVRSEERRTAVEAIATGAVAQPEAAVCAFNHLIAADPLLASDHGNALANAFTRAGQYDIASQFAATGPTEYRAAWLCTVYHQWAGYQPQAALASLEKFPDSAARAEARNGLFAGWSNSDPASLVTYAQTLPLGETRLAALKDGLAQWVSRDPIAASAWMDKFDPSPDLDAGAAAVAVAPALIAKKPEVAASWAESITDPELRANTLVDLIRLWAEHDPVAARRYAATTPALPSDRRELALSSLQPSP